MANYVLSKNNRYYVALESSYGVVPTVSAANRVPGVRLAVATQRVTAPRPDKTGTRTFLGLPGAARKITGYEFETSLMAGAGALPPAVGQMVQAALGAAAPLSATQTATVNANGAELDFPSAHNLAVGSAVTVGGEIRIVASVPSATSVELSAPLTGTVSGTAQVMAAAAYTPAKVLPSVSLFDYWDPSSTVQRIVRGAGVDEMDIQVDGTEHKLVFRGPAAENVDSASFRAPDGGLTAFPTEPAAQAETWAPVPGNLGQAWLGSPPSQVLTLTKALVRVKNNLMTRSFEFGSTQPLALSPGDRDVEVQFEVYSTDENVFAEMYQAAQTETPIALTIQLGDQAGAMAAVYIKTFVPQVPQFNDTETRLLWSFSNSRAQGTGNDEIYFAFG
jgi:hypothetical protein